MAGLQQYYRAEVVPQLREQLGYTDLPERTAGLSADRRLERLGKRAKAIGQLGILRIIDRTGDHGYTLMIECLL